MRKSLFIAAVIGAVATPAFADDVGVHVGPVGAGVTVGETHDHDRVDAQCRNHHGNTAQAGYQRELPPGDMFRGHQTGLHDAELGRRTYGRSDALDWFCRFVVDKVKQKWPSFLSSQGT